MNKTYKPDTSTNDYNSENTQKIQALTKEYEDAQMYADMDERDFWRTSLISPKQAQVKADILGAKLSQAQEDKIEFDDFVKKLKEEMYGNYADGYKPKIKFNKIIDKLINARKDENN